MLSLDPFDPLVLYRYRVELALAEPLLVDTHRRGVLWRGAFGVVFRSLVCHDLALACEACPLRHACPFPRVFAPTHPEGRPAIARLRDPPRPFVLSDPSPAAPSLPANVSLSLGLVLVGTAVVELPYFVVALRRLGDEGIGRRRTRFRVDAVRCVGGAGSPGDVVFEQGSDLVRARRLPIRACDLRRPGDEQAARLRVTFSTPTDLRGASAGVDDAPSFGVLVRRARDRAAALATFFGEGPLGCDPRAVGELADRVRLVHAETRRAAVSRRSVRTGQRHDVGGIVGVAVYAGDGVRAAMPWLRLAEVLGVGKHATFGNGRIAVDVLE